MPVYPFNIQLGPLQVTGYGIMMMVGFLVGGWLIAPRAASAAASTGTTPPTSSSRR